MKRKTTGTLILAMGLLASCAEEIAPPVAPARPVSYLTLAATSPASSARLAGTVESWKRVEMGFEVSGRVIYMADAGTEIQGERLDAAGKVVQEGTLIAQLDDERFQIMLNEANAQLAAATASRDAARTSLEGTLPQKLKAAEANLALQGKEVERFTRMVSENSAPQERLDQVEAAFDVAEATVEEVKSLMVTQAATVQAAEAKVALSEEMVEQAKLNIEYCTITAPFSGQISQIHMNPGGFATRGLRVATLQMMDPVKVQVALSAARDAEISYNDRVSVYLPDKEDPLDGYVYLKDTFADPSTRTFLATVFVRNTMIQDGESGVGGTGPKATELLGLQKRDPGGVGPYFVELDALFEDAEGFYVWKAEPVEGEAVVSASVVRATKVRVTPGEGILNLVQLFKFRELTDYGSIDPEADFLLRGLSGDVTEGSTVQVGRPHWLMRPGDVVSVGVAESNLVHGFYVPEETIQYDGQVYFVYAVQAGESGVSTAARIEVALGEASGSLREIRPVAEGTLAEGTRVVIAGAHYITNGEAINPMKEVELSR